MSQQVKARQISQSTNMTIPPRIADSLIKNIRQG